VTPESDETAEINIASSDSKLGRQDFQAQIEDLDLIALENVATSNPSVSESHASLLFAAGQKDKEMAGMEQVDLKEALECRLWRAADGK